MKGVLEKDFYYFFASEKRYWISYIVILVLFCGYDILTNYVGETSLFFGAFGIKELLIEYNFTPRAFLLFINIGIFVYMGLCFFLKEIKTSKDFLFLRISPKQWIFKKILSNLIYIGLSKLFLYIFIFLFYFIFHKISFHEGNMILKTYLLDISLTWFISSLMQFGILFFYKKTSIGKLISMIFLLTILFLGGTLLYQNHWFYTMLILLGGSVLLNVYGITIFKENYAIIFERLE